MVESKTWREARQRLELSFVCAVAKTLQVTGSLSLPVKQSHEDKTNLDNSGGDGDY